MQKFTVLMAMAVFLAATLFMAMPGFAQTQGGQGGVCPRGYTPGTGPGYGGGPGYCANPKAQTGSQSGSGYGSGYCYRNKVKKQVQSNNNLETPANSQPQSQTPGGGPAPKSGN